MKETAITTVVSRTRQIESWSVREESPQNRAFGLVHNRKSISRLADSEYAK